MLASQPVFNDEPVGLRAGFWWKSFSRRLAAASSSEDIKKTKLLLVICCHSFITIHMMIQEIFIHATLMWLESTKRVLPGTYQT